MTSPRTPRGQLTGAAGGPSCHRGLRCAGALAAGLGRLFNRRMKRFLAGWMGEYSSLTILVEPEVKEMSALLKNLQEVRRKQMALHGRFPARRLTHFFLSKPKRIHHQPESWLVGVWPFLLSPVLPVATTVGEVMI